MAHANANIEVKRNTRAPLGSVAAYERHASAFLDKNTWDYYSSGATDMVRMRTVAPRHACLSYWNSGRFQVTLRENRAAFAGFHIKRRVRASSRPDTRTTALGTDLKSPICAAASGKMSAPCSTSDMWQPFPPGCACVAGKMLRKVAFTSFCRCVLCAVLCVVLLWSCSHAMPRAR